jgi:hypothetical protein
MQRIRSYVAVLSLFATLCLTASAIAAPRSNDGPRANKGAQSQVQKEKAKPKGWIAKILDELENKVSIPPA